MILTCDLGVGMHRYLPALSSSGGRCLVSAHLDQKGPGLLAKGSSKVMLRGRPVKEEDILILIPKWYQLKAMTVNRWAYYCWCGTAGASHDVCLSWPCVCLTCPEIYRLRIHGNGCIRWWRSGPRAWRGGTFKKRTIVILRILT